jgi:hypothetical protein
MDWQAAQGKERERLREMAAATVAFGIIAWAMMRFLNNDSRGLLTAAGCFAAISVASLAARINIRRPEPRTFFITLAIWTGLIGVMVLAAVLTR